jgi:hypothetical protein
MLKSLLIFCYHVLKSILVHWSPHWEGISNRNGIALPAPYLLACFEIFVITAEVGAEDTRSVPATGSTCCASPDDVIPKREFL